MYGLAIGEQNNTKVSTFRFCNSSPAAYAPIGLPHLFSGVVDNVLHPFQTN